MEQLDKGAIFIPLVAGAMFLAFLWYVPAPEHPDAAPEPVTDKAPLTEPANAASISETPIKATRVYECNQEGQRVFSDRPCGDVSFIRDVVVNNTYSAPESELPFQSPIQTPSPMRSNGATQPATSDCTPYEESVKRIDDRMRQGYSDAEGEYWRGKRREAAAARDDCKRHHRLNTH